MSTISSALHVLKVVRIGRRQNTSIFEIAADKSGQELRGEGGEVFLPSRPASIQSSLIIVPTNVSAPWTADRQRLWQLADQAERRVDANLATLWEGHLPSSLSSKQIEHLATAFGQYLADYLNSAVDLSIHCESDAGVPLKLFALCSAREIGPLGFGEKNRFGLSIRQRLVRGFPTNHKTELIEVRSVWTSLCNASIQGESR